MKNWNWCFCWKIWIRFFLLFSLLIDSRHVETIDVLFLKKFAWKTTKGARVSIRKAFWRLCVSFWEQRYYHNWESPLCEPHRSLIGRWLGWNAEFRWFTVSEWGLILNERVRNGPMDLTNWFFFFILGDRHYKEQRDTLHAGKNVRGSVGPTFAGFLHWWNSKVWPKWKRHTQTERDWRKSSDGRDLYEIHRNYFNY